MVEILNQVYSVKSFQYKNTTEFNLKEVGSPIYGELTQTGTNMIISYFKNYFNKNAVFYDLGSGLGKMVLHVGILCGVKKSIGIEYSEERHKGATFSKEKYAKEYNNTYFFNESFLDFNYSDATIIYMDNAAFPKEMQNQFYSKIPKGCLLIYKENIPNIIENPVKVKNGTERTYRQNDFSWIIKE